MRFNLISLFEDDPRSHFQVLTLEASLRAAGFKSSLVFMVRKNRAKYLKQAVFVPSPGEIRLLIEKLKFLQTDAVGISVPSPLLRAACDVTRAIRNDLNIPVIWGGIHPTLFPEESCNVADAVCIGEGEDAIVRMADRLSKGASFDGIPGIWYRQNGAVKKNSLNSELLDINKLPLMDFDGADCHFICADGEFGVKHIGSWYSSIFSRGCLYHCSYCSENIVRQRCNARLKYRTRSPENIMAELRSVVRRRPVSVMVFEDALFPFDQAWVEEFCSAYKKEIGIPFATRLHPGLLNRRYLDLLSDAGLSWINISIESGSERVRREVFLRSMTNEQQMKAHRFLEGTKGIKVTYNLIVDNPYETEADKDEAFSALMGLNGICHLNPFSLLFFPGTDITTRALGEGKISRYHLDWALRPGAFYPDFFYHRSREDKHWYAIVLLISLYYEFHCLPKRVIPFFYRTKLIRRYPWLLYLVSFVLFKAGRKILTFKKRAEARSMENKMRARGSAAMKPQKEAGRSGNDR